MQTTLTLFALGSLLFAGTAVAAQYHNDGPLPAPSRQLAPLACFEPVAAPFDRSASTAGVGLRLRYDRRSLHDADGLARMQVRITSHDQVAAGERRACDVIVVLDRSGSMGGDKMAWAKRALHELLAEITPADRLSLLSFSSDLQTHIGLDDGRPRQLWPAIVEAIQPGGGTNMGSALQPALDQAERSRRAGREARVIVLSDGEVNEGLDTHSLLGETRRAISGEFVVSAVGIGTGFNEAFMQQLSDAGTGNYHYIKRPGDLGEIFVHEFQAAREQIARALRLVLDMPPGVAIREAAGYPVTREGNHASIALGGLRAGRARSFWLTLQAETSGAETVELPGASLHFVRGEIPYTIAINERPRLTVVRDQAAALAALDQETWSAGVVEEAFNQLREQVATAVREGDQAGAEQAIAQYQRHYRVANAVVGSAAVDDTLSESERMAAELEACFDKATPAAVQAERQNVYSKAQHADSFGNRRGSK